jgi:hypothetical protein
MALGLLRRLMTRREDGAPKKRLDPTVRLHVLPRMMQELRAVLTPRHGRNEPLALLLVRYVSEDNRQVVVGVQVQPFPDEAYVDGPDGANFAVPWLMNALDRVSAVNAGALLCHMHGHQGKPAFSGTDRLTNELVMAKQRLVNANLPYGAMVISRDDFLAVVIGPSGLREADVKTMVAYE